MPIHSKRKPYVREIKGNWWQKVDSYKFYFWRESTAIPTIWFCLILLYGIISIAKGPIAIYRFIAFLQNPIVFILNIITLAMICFNTYTWFGLTPKALNVIYKNERLPQYVIRVAMWIITAIATLVILILAYL